MEMDRRELGEVVLRLQAQYIRGALTAEIQEFESCFDEISQAARVFLVATEKAAQSPSLAIIDENAAVKILCRFIAVSNTILEFLDFQTQMTGLPSGGDVSLEKQVKAAQVLVEEFLRTLLLYQKAESYPGKELGMIYNEDVKFFSGFVLHKHQYVDRNRAPDPNLDNVDLEDVVEYWHPENIYHPLRQVPGNQWHKYFGNIQPGPVINPALFQETKPQPSFTVVFPPTIDWLAEELSSDYDTNRQHFENHGQLPDPRRPDHVRAAMIRRIQRRLSTHFEGTKNLDDEKIYHLEDLRTLPRPEFDIEGLSRLEALNAEVNDPELAGIALLGDDIPDVQALVVGEAVEYCIQSDEEPDL
ncbi:hypothetical protein MFIFM68171_02229 [Madurella fahalii]|uniref:Uncharacterized protein n=1 Tax=Madurella fahalii TaxID=1157608 RepID=A0ABQ0G2P3_9PEZI